MKEWGPEKKKTKFLKLVIPTNVDKTNKLSFANTSIDDESDYHEVREDPKDPLCAIKVFEYFWYVHAGSEY